MIECEVLRSDETRIVSVEVQEHASAVRSRHLSLSLSLSLKRTDTRAGLEIRGPQQRVWRARRSRLLPRASTRAARRGCSRGAAPATAHPVDIRKTEIVVKIEPSRFESRRTSCFSSRAASSCALVSGLMPRIACENGPAHMHPPS